MAGDSGNSGNGNWQAAAGAGISLLGNLASNYSAGKRQDKQNEENRKRADEQYARSQADETLKYQRQLDQWNRENLYNSPEQQMLRLKAGGLNPNMVYGTGVQAAGQTSVSSPRAETPKYQRAQAGKAQVIPITANVMAEYLRVKQQQANIDYIKANTQSIDQKTGHDQVKQQLAEFNRDVLQPLSKVKTEKQLEALDKAIKYKEGQIEGQKSTNKIKAWEAKLTDYDLTPRDSKLLRLFFMNSDLKDELLKYTEDQIRSLIEGIRTPSFLQQFLGTDPINPEFQIGNPEHYLNKN